jgi:hypothetical protein
MNQGAPTASAHAAAAAAAAVAPQPKPIRFVNNHEGPYAKRRRINTACLTCRRKKTRCSGERPVCSTCANNKHECAGYGDDNHNSNSTTTSEAKDTKKPAHKQSNAPPQKLQQPIDPQLIRPTLQPTVSTMSQRSDSTTTSHVWKHDNDGPTNTNGALTLSTRNRMPYFRYFGPTAIMPGFKQMVVKVRGKQHGSAQTTSDRLSFNSRFR